MNKQEIFFDLVKNRRSVRKFKTTPIPQEHITKILEAGSLAPTAGNRQPWKFLVIQSPEKINELKDACFPLRIEDFKKYSGKKEFTSDDIAEMEKAVRNRINENFSAPVFIVVFTDSNAKYSHYNLHDGALAAGYICLAAQALGYGTVYFTESISAKAIAAAIDVPNNYEFVCTIPVGIPDEVPESPKKKPFDELVVYNKF